MNATEKANSIEVATKIAAIASLFKHQFPIAKADLSPWADDSCTRELVDPDSIDISFNFPGVNKNITSRSVLLQIRFYEGKLIGIESSGFGYQGKQWSLSTVENWEFVGDFPPNEVFANKLRRVYRDIFELFQAN
ncbi:hypothetical protein Syn7502_01155 [Synechococcus sp. PCC 7502]|uniref:hypothetical protein n=1 Tax=Synechococcus sp. PCC 7502 TaxID=1173263 RepID=UPI00029FF1A1|nr:hypothetical protein [Synechococcus sp. PCC 7502]AFY73264.1 hypothetical protein Syn7502_01155 [Synechococcus sp. PCC 7502]